MGPTGAQLVSWELEGRRLARQLEQNASIVVLGENTQHAAAVAVGIARAESARRHVALGDLVGDSAPLYVLAGGEDAIGLADCLRDGLPLNDIARPAPECASLFVLPAGTPPVATEFVLAHERWAKLVRGFAQAGALLVLVAPLDAPGLDSLVAATDGVVAVDTLPARVKRFPVLATIDAPEPTTDVTVTTAAALPARWIMAAMLLLTLAGGAGWFVMHRRGSRTAIGAATGAKLTIALPAIGQTGAAAPLAIDTVRLGAVVNPADSAVASRFAVEVVAANTLAGANSVLRNDGELSSFPAPTISPVQLGGGTLWYKAVVGAWRVRGGADSLLAALRASAVVRSDNGLVVRVPYALLLSDSLAREMVAHEVDVWRGRGVTAYALLQDDGSARLYAGAFETPAQAAPLAASVRDAGTVPVVAFRTGRMF